MFVNCGRKLEYLERTHAWRNNKLDAEKPQAGILNPWLSCIHCIIFALKSQASKQLELQIFHNQYGSNDESC